MPARALRKRKTVDYTGKNDVEYDLYNQENVAPEPIRKSAKQVKASKSSKKSSGKPAKKRALSDKSNTQPKKHKAKEQNVETTQSKKSSTKKAISAKIQKNEPVMDSVNEALNGLSESDAMFQILKQQKTSYEELWKRYSSLESEMHKKQQDFTSKCLNEQKQKDKAVQKMVDYWKGRCQKMENDVKYGRAEKLEERNKQLKQACEKYKEKGDQLHKFATAAKKTEAHLEGELQKAQGTIRLYQMLTGVDCVAKKDETFCRIMNTEDRRVIEFALSRVSAENKEPVELGYRPMKIDTKGMAYPGYMDHTIEFSAAQAPRMLKRMMDAVYDKPIPAREPVESPPGSPEQVSEEPVSLPVEQPVRMNRRPSYVA